MSDTRPYGYRLAAHVLSFPELHERLARKVAPVVATILAQHVSDGWMDAVAAATYLGITPNALHKLTSTRTIPFVQDGPRARCYFKRSELDEWRERGRVRTLDAASIALPSRRKPAS